MGRKPIAPSQRAQPISFSLKPHLIAKIDDYASDMRFSRSKFLQQAVTEYMTRNIVNPNDMDLSSNVNDMTLSRRVAVGLAALQEANREGETISKPIMDALRRELGQYDYQESIDDYQSRRDAVMAESVNLAAELAAFESSANVTDSATYNEIKIVKSGQSEYRVHANEQPVAKIFKVGSGKLSWIVEDIQDGEVFGMYSTLRDAKANAEAYYESVKVA